VHRLSCYKRYGMQKGFTLLEVLVAVLILSFGLLGVAAMQLKAVQSAHVSYQRSLASIAAQDMEERLWRQLAMSPSNCPSDDDATMLQSWSDSWGDNLPGLIISPSPVDLVSQVNGCDYKITVEWIDDRFSFSDGLGGGKENVSSLVYFIRIPGAI